LKREKTKFVGVYKRNSSHRQHKNKPDICYDITYKVNDKLIREKVGWISEGYNAKMAIMIRAERIRAIRHGEELPQSKKRVPYFKINNIPQNNNPTLCLDLQSFKEKFQDISKNPKYTLPYIFDLLMKDLELPYTFKDVLKMTQKHNKNKVTVPAKLRVKVLERDNYTCQMCGAKAPDVKLHIDHIIPISRGGVTEEKNLRALCRDCNLGKSNLPILVKS